MRPRRRSGPRRPGSRPSWTTPRQLRDQVRRLWKSGRVLAAVVEEGTGYPRRLTLKRPTSQEMELRFDEVRDWISSLKKLPPTQVRLVWREVRHRSLGTNLLPLEAWVDSPEAAAALIGKRASVRTIRKLLETTRRQQPALVGWLARKPLQALNHAADWTSLLRVVRWLQESGRPGIYIREMDVEGVDTKFVERHRKVLSELLDLTLPPSAVDSSKTGVRNFEARYGFRSKPALVRARLLDPDLAILPSSDGDSGQDITVEADVFARWSPPVSRAIVVENEINFLSLPLMAGTLAIFGSGYGFERLGRARWLNRCRLLYWGDLDTHGFAILDELRSVFPHAESFLMDRQTLLAFRHLWVREPSQAHAKLSRLTLDERELYDALRFDSLGESVRLEQERVGFRWVQRALARLSAGGVGPA